jgi:undecaprenyl diphosphate synthase
VSGIATTKSDRTSPSVTPLEAINDPEARAVVERMRRVNPHADPTRLVPTLDPARIPRHVAIIMDGNGRWARERGFPREFGHRNGAVAVRRTIEEAGRLGIECLTLYSFSAENWKRPVREVDELIRLYLTYMDGERDALVRQNIRFRQIGRREDLPPDAQAALDRTLEATARCTGPMLCLAVNYGARDEITGAVRRIAERVRDGELDADRIDHETIASSLYTAGIPDPDLLIRTAGEMRISNFLLWQISYAELYVTETLWPDFGAEGLFDAVRAYARRERRFGGLEHASASEHPLG